MSSKLEGEEETTNNEEWAQCCAWWHEPVTRHLGDRGKIATNSRLVSSTLGILGYV